VDFEPDDGFIFCDEFRRSEVHGQCRHKITG
jgi:hypothetical protein